ncbi:MAG TPA: outer membrane lipid asymmetry maintenance protein MlaD [Polyangia bacterium]|nr:outer membrane lipid asymmetry maintenance protein MlaD [Polyangia bacterium]
MFEYTKAEITAGVFVVLGLAVLGYLSISIGGLKLLPQDSYRVTARFSNVGDLKMRAPVKVAGVTVGRVTSIRLDEFFGQAELAIDRGVKLPKDSIASITTAGLLGDAFVSLSPGGAEQDLPEGGRITQTEPALNVADLLGRYAFGSADRPGAAAGEGTPDKATTPRTTPSHSPEPGR